MDKLIYIEVTNCVGGISQTIKLSCVDPGSDDPVARQAAIQLLVQEAHAGLKAADIEA